MADGWMDAELLARIREIVEDERTLERYQLTLRGRRLSEQEMRAFSFKQIEELLREPESPPVQVFHLPRRKPRKAAARKLAR